VGATSLLFGTQPEAARGEYLDSAAAAARAARAAHQPTEPLPEGAPLATEHPPAPSTTDAPPADGHPSQSPASERLRAQISQVRDRMAQTLALIDEKDA
jgi:hypothetical protein